MRPDYFPAFLNLRGKKCVVIGGGKVAARKVSALLKSGALVDVISPEITASLKKLQETGRINYVDRGYRKGDLKGAFLTVAATSDYKVNIAVSKEAPLLVNVVDVPELCNFIVPAVVDRAPLTIAVSTGGASPAMAASVRKELELLYGKEVGRYLLFAGNIRKTAKEAIADTKLREIFFKYVGSEEILLTIRKEGFGKAKEKIKNMLTKLRGTK